MRSQIGYARVPSNVGGWRPQVRDDRGMQFRRVSSMRADVQKAEAKLAKMHADLAVEQEVLDNMRQECAHCGACSACVGG